MKKLGPIIFGIIIGAVLTYYFCPRQCADMPTIGEEVVIPKGVISVAEATVLNDNWTKYRKPEIDSITQRQVGKNDNRWAGWSLEDIENYIDFAKREAKKQQQEIAGFRIYFGVYGEKAPNDKGYLSTLFWAPQLKAGTSKASFSNFSSSAVLEIPPLNAGTGGQGGYPQ
ncbi:hypothetical protein [uncultured Algibacter sp.]|uniref:hypothetical protein n=1 Tax=uncultured Algibacter sp. TaxID=298659 RepID=UPI0026233FA3|nr:hypothetical protein [uncultured Algibacter sp.]